MEGEEVFEDMKGGSGESWREKKTDVDTFSSFSRH